MVASNFRPSLTLVLAHEGGYVNHPADPGGPTNFGVTQRVYDAYRQKLGQAPRTVRSIEATEVQDIYNKSYWRLIRGDSLPCGIDYCVFDFGVNSGISRAVRYLQRVVGVADDGVIGDMTLNACYDYARRDEEGFIATYCANRMAFLRSLGTFGVFGKGWTRRVIGGQPGVQATDNGVLDFATMMARRDQPAVMPSPIGTNPGEIPAKADADLTPQSFPVAAPTTLLELKGTLPEINDQLAAMVAQS